MLISSALTRREYERLKWKHKIERGSNLQTLCIISKKAINILKSQGVYATIKMNNYEKHILCSGQNSRMLIL